MTTLLIAEHDNASIKDATAKALTAALAISSDVHVLVAGASVGAIAADAATLSGVAKVLTAEAAALDHQLAEPMAALLVAMGLNAVKRGRSMRGWALVGVGWRG